MWPAGPLSAECVGNHGHLARLGQEHQEDQALLTLMWMLGLPWRAHSGLAHQMGHITLLSYAA